MSSVIPKNGFQNGARKVLIAASSIAIVLLSFFGGMLAAGSSPSRVTTSFVTVVNTTTETVSTVSQRNSTVAMTETIPDRNSTSSSALSPNGILLSASFNATSILVGESITVELSLSNPLPTVNNVTAASASEEWPFNGVYAAVWPPCDGLMPVRVAVLNGSYTAQELPAVANASFSVSCAQSDLVNNVIFQPMSEQAILTGCIFSAAGCTTGPIGSFSLAANFTTSGSWSLQDLARIGDSIVGEHGEGPIPSTSFAPGVYTIAATDEWGAVVVLYLNVFPAA